jgi:hypothetical protein
MAIFNSYVILPEGRFNGKSQEPLLQPLRLQTGNVESPHNSNPSIPFSPRIAGLSGIQELRLGYVHSVGTHINQQKWGIS